MSSISSPLPRRGRSPERAVFLAGVVTTAVEGGIGYWAGVHRYHWWFAGWGDDGSAEHRDGEPNAYAVISEIENDLKYETFFVGPDQIATALARIADFSKPIRGLHHDYRRHITAASRENDGGEIDAGDADIIVQVACFGNEVIYG